MFLRGALLYVQFTENIRSNEQPSSYTATIKHGQKMFCRVQKCRQLLNKTLANLCTLHIACNIFLMTVILSKANEIKSQSSQWKAKQGKDFI